MSLFSYRVDDEQDAKQREHCELFGELIAHDLKIDGRHFSQLYRTHRKGGRAVYLRESLPGSALGHGYCLFEIKVEGGKEQLGEQIGEFTTLDWAIRVAST